MALPVNSQEAFSFSHLRGKVFEVDDEILSVEVLRRAGP